MNLIRMGGKKIVSGAGSISHIAELNVRKAVIVTGKSAMQKAGFVDKISEIIGGAGGEVRIFSGVGTNPEDTVCEAGARFIADFAPDTVIALGGGSAIDAAKIMTVMAEFPYLTWQGMIDGKMPEERKKISLVAVPSTSGTGTEVTWAAVVTFAATKLKIGLRSAMFIPDVAILDVDVTQSMPENVAVESGMDALTHAVEGYINKSSNAFTTPLAQSAAVQIFNNIAAAALHREVQARSIMHEAQCLAGLAFSNTGLGMAHGISHAFGGLFGMPHGLLNAVLLPYVLEFNRRDSFVNERLQQLESILQKGCIVQALHELNKKLGVPDSLRAAGVSESDFVQNFEWLTDVSMQGGTRVNPAAVSRSEMQEILRRVYDGKSTGDVV